MPSDSAALPKSGLAKDAKSRAFSGLILVFLLSFLSLAGILLTIKSLGGLGAWTRWQFIGLFGVIEAASGLANVIAPNIWRLPVVELTSDSRAKARLAVSTMLLPHWGAAARVVAGLLLIIMAGRETGFGPGSAAVVPLILCLAVSLIAVSALLARAGVAAPHYDVFQMKIRWAKREADLTPVSISASVLQFVLSIATIPLIKILEPEALFQPEIAPSAALLAGVVFVAGLTTVATVVAWADLIDWRAPIWQQREAERNA